MPKIVAADMKKMGFVQEMFGKEAEAGFDAWLDAEVIAEQALLLEGRIGSSAYASATEPTKTYVKRAERCLCAVELYDRRFIVIAQEVNSADGIDAFKLRRQQEKYEKEAAMLISTIANGTTADTGGYSGSTLVTSHFDD